MYSLRCFFFLLLSLFLLLGFFSYFDQLCIEITYPSGLCGCQTYIRGRAGTQKQKLIPTRVTDPINPTFKTCVIDDYSPYNNLTPIPTLKWRLPTLFNSNAISIVHKIDEMTNIIDDYEVDVACVTETWLSDEVPHCVTDIVGYTGVEEGQS